MWFWESIQKARKKFLPFRSAITKALNTGCSEWAEKSGCKRYPDSLCLWSYWNERSPCRCLSKDKQRCIVHQVRNTLKYVPDKDRKAFATDLKTIYQAPDEKKALVALDRVTEKWTHKYPNSMKRWKDNWDAISLIFKFSSDVRKVIYTTNAIESLNSTYRRLNQQRSVFPSDTALLKTL